MPDRVRLLGALVGLVVASIFIAGALAIDRLGGGNPIEPSVAPPIAAAGLAGGWMVAPMAWLAGSRRAWLRVVASLAILAVVIGDAWVVISLAESQATDPMVSPWFHDELPWIVVPMASLFVLGLMVVGWWALAFTALAAGLWAASMAILRARLDPRSRAR